MSHRLTIVAPIALTLLGGAAWSQTDPQTVGVSVDGTVVEVPVDLAAQACGISAETLLEQWEQLDTQMSTMADTTVAADATDLAPVASSESTQKAAGVGGEAAQGSGEEGTDTMAGAGKGPASGTPADSAANTDTADAADAVAGGGDFAPVVAAAAPQASAAANPQDALDETAAPTEGTALSKAAVCEIDAQKAAGLGIKAPG